MRLRRREDWPERLAASIEAARCRPFRWGAHDCVLWSAEVVAAMTGTDLAADWRGSYDDALGARRLLQRLGASDAARLAGNLLGNSVPVAQARRGDVVAIDTLDHGLALGICTGQQTAFTGPEGLLFAPTLGCVQAWWVGD